MTFYKLFFSLIIILTHNVWSQQNLVPNGSFEELRLEYWNDYQYAVDCFLDCGQETDLFRSSNFGTFQNKDDGLVHCWYKDQKNSTLSSVSGGTGMSYVLAPDLFLSNRTFLNNLDCSVNSCIPISTNPDGSDRRVLSSELATEVNNAPGLRLQYNEDSELWGFDLSPPDSKFGNGVNAQNGANYVALVDYSRAELAIEDNKLSSKKPGIICELKESLIEGENYKFTYSRCKMNQLNQNEFWDEVKDPRIKIILGKNINGSGEFTGPTFTITTDEIDFENWETTTYIFEANNNWKYLKIEIDPIGSPNNSQISGAFIDNLKLHKTCETSINQCNNPNYNLDMLDVKLKTVEVTDPLAYENHNQQNKDYLKTIKAINLDNVKRFEMKIYQGNTLVRTIDEYYPSSEYKWDGNNQSGAPMPEGWYKAVINGLSNDCPNYHLTNHDEKTFQLQRKYMVFPDVDISTVVIESSTGQGIIVPAIKGLDKVHWLNIKVFSTSGSLLFDQSYNNPANDFLLSTSLGNTSGTPFLASGLYKIKLQMSNNCMSSLLGNNWDYFNQESNVSINPFNSYIGLDQSLFNWYSQSKPPFQCPFDYSYPDNYLPPRDCCEGNLYLNNVEINSSWNANILFNIFIGENTVFSSASGTNVLYAGESIILDPNDQSIIVGNNTSLVPNQYNCATCIIVDDGVEMSENSVSKDDFVEFYYNDSIYSRDAVLYPNPLKKEKCMFFVESLELGSGVKSVSLFSSLGKQINNRYRMIKSNLINIEPLIKIESGHYFVYVELASGEYIKLSLIVE